MKKILLAAIMMVAAMNASAQFEPGTFTLKPQIGFGISTVSNMEDISVPIVGHYYELDKTVKPGFQVGLEFEYQAKKWLGIAVGLNYISQGMGWENFKSNLDGIKYNSYNNQLDLGYINLPIVAKFYVAKGLALKTGLQFGFLTDAHLRTNVRASHKEGDVKIDNLTQISENFYDECNKFDLAIPVGLSYEFKHHFVIDARYNIGLLKVNKDEMGNEDKHRNGSFQMSFGWKFGLNKKNQAPRKQAAM